MSSQKFELLDEDIQELLDEVSKKKNAEISRHCEEEHKQFILKLDESLNKAKTILNKMEIELRQAPAKYQISMKSKIDKYNEEIQRHRKAVNQLRYSNVYSNELHKPNTTATSYSDNIRKQILMGAASMERTSESLERSHAIALETERTGTEVLGELGTQREALERTRDRLVDTQEEIGRSRRLIRKIATNFLFNKFMLICIIILEILILACLCYWKFFM